MAVETNGLRESKDNQLSCRSKAKQSKAEAGEAPQQERISGVGRNGNRRTSTPARIYSQQAEPGKTEDETMGFDSAPATCPDGLKLNTVRLSFPGLLGVPAVSAGEQPAVGWEEFATGRQREYSRILIHGREVQKAAIGDADGGMGGLEDGGRRGSDDAKKRRKNRKDGKQNSGEGGQRGWAWE